MAHPGDPPPLRALALPGVTLVLSAAAVPLSSRDVVHLRRLVARLRRARAANGGG